jgi:hypothetical protein
LAYLSSRADADADADGSNESRIATKLAWPI